MSDAIEFRVRDGVAVATLNRPDAYNALDLEAARAWQTITHEVTVREEISALVITARGRAFCAGGDLQAMAEGGGTVVSEIARLLNDGILAILSSDKPVVAAITGVVAGGGLGLLLASDYAIAGEGASFSARYAAVGLSPDASVTALLSRAVGERRARAFILQDGAISAREAHDWGLVAEVVATEDVEARSLELAASWAANSQAIAQTKRLLRVAPDRPLAATLDDEADTIARLFDSDASMTKVGRFLSKRGDRG